MHWTIRNKLTLSSLTSLKHLTLFVTNDFLVSFNTVKFKITNTIG